MTSPLIDAIKASSVTGVFELVNTGANVNEPDSDGTYPIHFAVRENSNSDILRILLDKKALVDVKDNLNNTSLYTAIKKRKIQFVKLLIQKNADLNLVSGGELPLNLSLKTSQDQMARILIKNNCNVNAIDENGEHSLFSLFKSSEFKSDILKLLKNNNVNPAIKNKVGKSSLFFAIDSMIKLEAYQKYFKADFNERDSFGITPFLLTASLRDYKVFLKALEFGGDITAKDDEKKNILHYALRGNNKTVEFLLKQRLNSEEPNVNGLTPLLYMCKSFNNSHQENLVSCLRHGCNPNVIGQKNYSSLMYLIKKGNYVDGVIELLKSNASKDHINSDGKTALDMALERKYSDIVELLRN
jgi:ankyrin repeat protein